MIPVQTAKDVSKIVVTVSVGYVVSNGLGSVVPATSTYQKVRLGVGAIVLGSLVTDAVSKHVEKKIDAAYDWYNKNTNH